jgi:hypothetical protein
VGNLPAATTKKRLRQLFARCAARSTAAAARLTRSSCGAVDTTRIRSATVDPEAKLPRRAALLTGTLSASRGAVNGYVVFKSAEAVEAALALNMQPLDGRHVRVDRVRAAGEGRAERGAASLLLEPRRSAYLGNLHYGVDEEEVIALFSSAGAIEAVRIPRDRDSGAAKGFAYVCFAEPGAAAALRSALALAGTELRGRPLRVARASSQRLCKGSSLLCRNRNDAASDCSTDDAQLLGRGTSQAVERGGCEQAEDVRAHASCRRFAASRARSAERVKQRDG